LRRGKKNDADPFGFSNTSLKGQQRKGALLPPNASARAIKKLHDGIPINGFKCKNKCEADSYNSFNYQAPPLMNFSLRPVCTVKKGEFFEY
jgi:hypothetical protein